MLLARRLALASLLVALSASGCAGSPPLPPQSQSDFDPVLGAQLQQALAVGITDDSCFGMTAAAWVPGKGLWRGAVGQDDIQKGTPMPLDGIFRLGSITKTFVATVFLQLETEGKLSVDDKLSRWVPTFPGAETITMRQVLSHTSGIYNYSDSFVFLNAAAMNPKKVWTPQELISYAAAEPLYFPPGTGFHYSNTDYILAGLAVEAATGHSIAAEIRARILDKLALHSAFFASAEPEPQAPHLVRGYDDGQKDLTYFYDMSASWAAGALASDAEDITRFMIALQTGQLLDAQHSAEMRAILGGGYYGLGLMEHPSALGKSFGHDGLVIGYWTQAAWFEPSGAAVSVLCDVITLPQHSPIKHAWDGIVGVLAAAQPQMH